MTELQKQVAQRSEDERLCAEASANRYRMGLTFGAIGGAAVVGIIWFFVGRGR
jgi:hypothetical protein